jgi:ribosomal-protein-alanine N-acetyltransferase
VIKPKIERRQIETDKLILKPYHVGVEADLFRLIQDNLPDLTQSFPQMLSATRTLEDTKEYIQAKIRQWNKNEALPFLIYHNDVIAGHFNLKDIDWKVPRLELAYWIDHALRRKGLMTEVIAQMLQFGFNGLGMERIMAKVVTSNIASERVLQKAGMKYEGTFIKDYRTFDNRIVDTHIYALTKSDFIRLQMKHQQAGH